MKEHYSNQGQRSNTTIFLGNYPISTASVVCPSTGIHSLHNSKLTIAVTTLHRCHTHHTLLHRGTTSLKDQFRHRLTGQVVRQDIVTPLTERGTGHGSKPTQRLSVPRNTLFLSRQFSYTTNTHHCQLCIPSATRRNLRNLVIVLRNYARSPRSFTTKAQVGTVTRRRQLLIICPTRAPNTGFLST